MRVLWIGAGGFAGAIARYALDGLISDRARGAFPWGIFAVNVSGAFAAGLVFAALAQRLAAGPAVRAALLTGFLGAYTTFSTLMLDSLRLAENGAVLRAAGNVAGSVAVGLVAVVLGTWAGRSL